MVDIHFRIKESDRITDLIKEISLSNPPPPNMHAKKNPKTEEKTMQRGPKYPIIGKQAVYLHQEFQGFKGENFTEVKETYQIQASICS